VLRQETFMSRRKKMRVVSRAFSTISVAEVIPVYPYEQAVEVAGAKIGLPERSIPSYTCVGPGYMHSQTAGKLP